MLASKDNIGSKVYAKCGWVIDDTLILGSMKMMPITFLWRLV